MVDGSILTLYVIPIAMLKGLCAAVVVPDILPHSVCFFFASLSPSAENAFVLSALTLKPFF